MKSSWILRNVIFILAISLPTSALAICARTWNWTEDVLLHDGRVVKIYGETCFTLNYSRDSFLKSWPDKYLIKFEHPDTHETIKWQGERYFDPVLLDIIDGIPYLVVHGGPNKDTEEIYGCPELPYIYLKYENGFRGKWTPVPSELAPSELAVANLYTHAAVDGRNHATVESVKTSIRLAEESKGSFQGKIPHNYDEWHNIYKNSYRNERLGNDCRPPRTPLPPVTLPAAMVTSPEVLDTVSYKPEHVSTENERVHLFFDQIREGACKKLFKPTDPDDNMQDQRFINDSTGNKRVPYSKNGQFQMGTRVLCDEHVWFITHQEEKGKMIITQYTIGGDLTFRVSFPQPELIPGFVGYISIPSLRTEAGYLYFDWMDFRDINREWHIKRILKMRVQVPHSQSIKTMN